MKDSLENLACANRNLKEIEQSIEVAQSNTYYAVFNRPQEKERDLKELYEAKKTALELKHTALENLSLDINKELNFISQMQREQSLKKAL